MEALASAIDVTDVGEAMRLAAEFSNSFRDLVQVSVGTESVMAQDDVNLLGYIGPATGEKQGGGKSKDAKRKSAPKDKGSAGVDDVDPW